MKVLMLKRIRYTNSILNAEFTNEQSGSFENLFFLIFFFSSLLFFLHVMKFQIVKNRILH